MLQIISQSIREEAPIELSEKADYLSQEFSYLSTFIKNMPAVDSWDKILRDWEKIKARVSEFEQLLNDSHHSRPIPDWLHENQMQGVL